MIPDVSIDVLLYIFLTGVFFLLGVQKDAVRIVAAILSACVVLLLWLTFPVSAFIKNTIPQMLLFLIILVLLYAAFMKVRLFGEFQRQLVPVLFLSPLAAGLLLSGFVSLMPVHELLKLSPLGSVIFGGFYALFAWVVASVGGIVIFSQTK